MKKSSCLNFFGDSCGIWRHCKKNAYQKLAGYVNIFLQWSLPSYSPHESSKIALYYLYLCVPCKLLILSKKVGKSM